MRFLYDGMSVLFVSIPVCLLAWLFGGTDGPLVVSVAPWLVLLLVQAVVFFPQRREGETLYDAREAAWESMKKDPLVWIVLSLTFILAIPFLNNALCPICDAAAISQGEDPGPRIKFLPFCVSRRDHFCVFLWIVTALFSAVAVKHSLRARGKRLLLKIIVWNGTALAALGFVQIALAAPGPLWVEVPMNSPGGYFSTWGYPNMAGIYFVALFALAVALWRRSCDESAAEAAAADTSGETTPSHRAFWRKHLFLIPAGVFFFASLNTLSRAAIVLAVCLFLVFFVHAFISFTHKMKRARRVKYLTVTFVSAGIVSFFALVSIPDKMQEQVDSIDTRGVLTRMTGKDVSHSRIGVELWRENTLFGCGGWGYRHFAASKMTKVEKESLPYVGNANVHNDYLQFLVEHGCVGLVLLCLAALCLVFPVFRAWRYLLNLVRFAKTSKLPAKPVILFVLPPAVFCALASPLAIAIHAFADCPLRSPAILVLLYVVLAALPAFLPRRAREIGAAVS